MERAFRDVHTAERDELEVQESERRHSTGAGEGVVADL
jgi:hypothetical protein